MGKIALLFAGQGAQYPGMGRDLYENSPAARGVFDMAERLKSGTKRLCFESDAAELSETKNTQPALFTMDLACAAALGEAGIFADLAAGFSLGEVPALAYCGFLSREDAFLYVVKRGLFMQEAATENPGSMVAVLRLSVQTVEKLCADFDRVYPVNYNCPGQVVVAGDTEELDAFCGLVAENKGMTIKLKVSGAFHTPLMNSAYEKLSLELKSYEFTPPRIPLYSNTDAEPLDINTVANKAAIQVKSPVRWEQTIKNMIRDKAEIFIEVGAGKVLSGFLRKISPGVKFCNVEKYEDIEEAMQVANNR